MSIVLLEGFFETAEKERCAVLRWRQSTEEFADEIADQLSENMEIRRRHRFKFIRDIHVLRGPVDLLAEIRYEEGRNTRFFVRSLNDHLIFK